MEFSGKLDALMAVLSWESVCSSWNFCMEVIAHYNMNSCTKCMEVFRQHRRWLRPPLPDNSSLEECNGGKVKSEKQMIFPFTSPLTLLLEPLWLWRCSLFSFHKEAQIVMIFLSSYVSRRKEKKEWKTVLH